MTLLLAAAGMLSIQAEEKAISAAEFAAAEKAADAPFAAKQTPARWTIDTESRMEGRPQTDWVSRSVMEFGADRSLRTTSTSKFGNVPQKTEIMIKVGKHRYTRTGDGNWKETDVEAKSQPLQKTEGENEAAGRQVEYKDLGDAVFEGKKVRMFLQTELKKDIATAGATRQRIRGLDQVLVRSERRVLPV